jgi:acetylornithine deacetylase/succinyl-diaminopimelate desuccinylase-like protein
VSPEISIHEQVRHQLSSYTDEHHPRFVAELQEFVRFPSISAQPWYAGDVQNCAVWLANHLRRIGLEQVDIVPTPRHPVVYADWRRRLLRTAQGGKA